eukprot:scaffold1965_cov192-Pinguiococcus_pyrenoidosus.AAC.2
MSALICSFLTKLQCQQRTIHRLLKLRFDQNYDVVLAEYKSPSKIDHLQHAYDAQVALTVPLKLNRAALSCCKRLDNDICTRSCQNLAIVEARRRPGHIPSMEPLMFQCPRG